MLATAPVASSGAWNSILPNTSLTWTSVEDVCSFNTEPASDFEVKLLTIELPETVKLLALVLLDTVKSVVLTSPVAVTFLNPLISLLVSTINAFPAETVPSTTVFNLLISSALDVIAVPPRIIEFVVVFPAIVTSLKPLISFSSLTTTALPADTTPLTNPLKLLISSPVEVISVCPSWIEFVVNFPSTDKLLSPATSFWSSATRALPADTVPETTLSNLFISTSLIVVFPTIILLALVAIVLATSVPTLKSFTPAKLAFESKTRALPAEAVPAVTWCNVFNSLAVEVTRDPPNFNPPVEESCETISIDCPPKLVPIRIAPELFWVTTLPSLDCPGTTPSNTANEVPFNVVAPTVKLLSIVKSLVTCWSPLIVTSPPVTFTLPEESIVNLSWAAWDDPVIKDNFVALLVLLKSPSDLAIIDADTILATSPVLSSGDWNSILPITSSTWISVDPDCNFNTAPLADFEVILLVTVEPATWISFVIILPLPVILLNPDTLLLLSTDTTRPPEITPATTSFNKLILSAEAVTSVPPRFKELVVNFPEIPTLLNPVTSLWLSTITAFPATTAPGVISSSLLISSAMAVIFTPPMSSVSALNSPVIVILFIPDIFLLASRTTAFSADPTPAVTPSR